MIASDLVRRGCERILKKRTLLCSPSTILSFFLLIPLLPESKVNASVDPRPSTACDVMSLTIKDNLVIYLLQGKRRGSVLKRGVGAHLPISHTHTPTEIFQTALCVVRWHKQSFHSV